MINLIKILPILLFLIGLYGLVFNKKNVILIIMALEILLLSVNLNFIIFSLLWWDILGQIFSLYVLTIAAAESAIGLAIVVVYYRLQGTILTEKINNIKG